MATIRGLSFPDDRFYHARHMVWLREEPDHRVTLGMSALALATAGEFLVFAARPLGALIACDRAIGNVETAKTVNSVRTPVAGRIVEINAAVEADGGLIQRDPYAAWLVRLEPEDWLRDRVGLARGEAARQALQAELDLYGVSE